MTQGLDFGAGDKESLIVELIIPPQSSLLGEKLLESSLQLDPDIQIVAIKRRRLHYTEQKIQNVKLRVGDIILIRCPKNHLIQIRGQADFIIVEDVHHEIVHKRKAPLALMIFAAVICAASTGLAEIMVCALTGAFLMILPALAWLKSWSVLSLVPF
jgi:hypothetical protein